MSNGIDFVIGGKDKARPAMSSVERSLQRLEQKTDRLRDSTVKLSDVTARLAKAYAAVKSVILALRGVQALNDAYDQQTAAVEGLEVALRLQGDAVESNSTRLQSFASDLQEYAAVGDEVTLGLMRQASMLGVNSDQLDDAAATAIGLSEATGRSLDESLKLVNNALAGQFESFGEVLPQIRQMQTEDEKLAAVLDLANRGLEAKAEASTTVAGSSERASNAIGDLMEVVGEILAPIRVLISAGLQTMAEALQSVLAPAAEYAQGVLANIGPLVEWVQEKVIAAVNAMVAAFTFFEVILTNLDSVWELVVSQAELYMLQISGTISHTLTEVIPAYVSWFGENFVNLIRDAFSLAFTVVKNAITQILDAIGALWDFIASGGSSDVLGKLGEIAGRSYLEGFESSLTSLPEIAGRAITDREAELSNTINGIASDLGQQFADKMADRMVTGAAGLGDKFSTEIDLQLNKRKEEDAAAALGGGGGGTATLSATESRLLTRGPAEKPEDILMRILTAVNNLMATTQSNDETKNGLLTQIEQNTGKTIPVFLPE